MSRAFLQRPEQECWNDADVRAHRRERGAEHRAELDQEYVLRWCKLCWPGCILLPLINAAQGRSFLSYR